MVRYTIFGLQKRALAGAPQGDSILKRENQVYMLRFNASDEELQHFITQLLLFSSSWLSNWQLPNVPARTALVYSKLTAVGRWFYVFYGR
jgi:hypothetical protein